MKEKDDESVVDVRSIRTAMRVIGHASCGADDGRGTKARDATQRRLRREERLTLKSFLELLRLRVRRRKPKNLIDKRSDQRCVLKADALGTTAQASGQQLAR